MKISDDFSATENENIISMGAAWDEAMEKKVSFFSFGAVVPNKSNNIHPDELYDSEFGIYKTTVWPDEIPDSALAITQIFGRRYNVGKADEYVAIEHADILVNFDPEKGYQFDSVDDDDDTGYDLRTVILHEMGHFLGLQHIPSYTSREDGDKSLSFAAYKASSVMYPSISNSEIKRFPMTRDENELYYKYLAGTTAGSALATASKKYVPAEGDEGLNARIILELRPEGECVHWENGAVIRRHHVRLK